MRLVERLGDLDGDLQRVVDLDRSTFESLRQRLALDVLHDEIVGPVLVANVIERADVRVRQRGNRLRLALESGLQFGICRR